MSTHTNFNNSNPVNPNFDPASSFTAGGGDRFTVTRFNDTHASTKVEWGATLDELSKLIEQTSAPSKSQLPLFKLAKFGNVRSDKNSLRHNANLIEVYGIEADYDGEVVGPAEAKRCLEQHGIKAILYTSPSHSRNKPRWRILCPFSTPLPPHERARMMDRLQLVFSGVVDFADESWTLSQSYYFGHVEGAETFAVHVIDGRCIDELDELDELERVETVNGKHSTGKAANGSGNDRHSSQSNGHKAAGSGLGFDLKNRLSAALRRKLLLDGLLPNDPSKFAEGQPLPSWFTRPGFIDLVHAIKGSTAPAERASARAEWLTWCQPYDACAEKRPRSDGKPFESHAAHAWDKLRDEPDAGLGKLEEIFDGFRGAGAFQRFVGTEGGGVQPGGNGAQSGGYGPQFGSGDNEWPPASELYDPFTEYFAPAFPIDVLPRNVRFFVEQTASSTGVCISSVAVSALVTLSAALTHEATLYLKSNFRVRPNLWGLLVGPPSFKKTPAQNAALAPLWDIQRNSVAKYLEAKKRAEQAGEDPPPLPRQFIVNDTTPEALIDITSRQDSGILIHADELAGLIGSLDRYTSGKGAFSHRALMLKGHDGGPYTVNRKGGGIISCTNLSWSILGGIQPDRLQQVIKDLHTDGLLQRFLPVMMRQPKFGGDDIDVRAEIQWEAAMRAAAAVGAFETQLSAEARHEYRRIDRELFDFGQAAGTESAAFQAFVGKLIGIWGRLCLLLHVVWGFRPTDPVTGATAIMATKLIWEFFLLHGLVFFRSLHGSQSDHKAIGAVIVGHDEPTITARHFNRRTGCCRHKSAEDIAKMVSPFVMEGWLKPVGQLGSHTSKWTINPAVKTMFAEQAARHRELWQTLVQSLKTSDPDPEEV